MVSVWSLTTRPAGRSVSLLRADPRDARAAAAADLPHRKRTILSGSDGRATRRRQQLLLAAEEMNE